MEDRSFLQTFTLAACIFATITGLGFLVRSGQPSADVLAKQREMYPLVAVSAFQPGDVQHMRLNSRAVIIWRRNDADKALAAQQNDPTLWRFHHSKVLGGANPVFASDENLTLEGEWLIVLAEHEATFARPLLLRAGDYGGLFEGHYATHYDLAGRSLKGLAENLTIIASSFTEDRRHIRLDLSGKLKCATFPIC